MKVFLIIGCLLGGVFAFMLVENYDNGLICYTVYAAAIMIILAMYDLKTKKNDS